MTEVHEMFMKCSYVILETEHSGYLIQEILLAEKHTGLNPSIKWIKVIKNIFV